MRAVKAAVTAAAAMQQGEMIDLLSSPDPVRSRAGNPLSGIGEMVLPAP